VALEQCPLAGLALQQIGGQSHLATRHLPPPPAAAAAAAADSVGISKHFSSSPHIWHLSVVP
jgi:hypothetical protein